MHPQADRAYIVNVIEKILLRTFMSAEFNSQFEMRNAQLFVKVVLYYNDDKLLQCEEL